jgi:3-mercaptopyruvate sulfurtransferase SseA
MLQVLRYCLTGCLLLAQPLMAAEGIKGHLVDVGWLGKNLKNADVLILDASPNQAYTAKHIPGAVNINAYELFSYGFQGVPVAAAERLYQSWGISSGKKIVLYDSGGTFFATRVFFSLYHDGFPAEDLFVLDGGLFKWQKEGLPVSAEATPAPNNGSFKITKPNSNARVELPEVLAGSGDPANYALMEALDPGWHFGEVHPFNKAGHIPFGILTPSADFYNPDKTFKSPEEIRRMLAYLGIKPDQQIYTYCGGGVAASVPYFAAKFILNYPKVKLFQESELGWVSDERDLPYWTFDAPYLMREASWLQFRTGKMMRAFLDTHVSIVDVRNSGEFNQGHVPFALNIPAEVFKSNIVNPDRLAGILGPAGVNASHEAVVISGAGLTRDAALAFVLLEKLGQKKVSVFTDSAEKCAQLGFVATKEPTVVGPKKDPQDLSIPPTTYPVNLRKDVVITDPKISQGAYPKVFLASGKGIPAKAPDGKVVHIPYTELVNADGTPKAAKDIWNILAKAGVPRYAELICFSDDPGEAAVNYFVLQLMGFPDIKVWVI